MAKPTPDRVSIKTRLTKARIDNYWRELGYSKEYWLEECSAALRYELVLDYLLNQERLNNQDLDNVGN